MATSLAAIGMIALVGTISYAIRGDVQSATAAWWPAGGGRSDRGTALQQRVAGPMLSYGFAVLLAASGSGSSSDGRRSARDRLGVLAGALGGLFGSAAG